MIRPFVLVGCLVLAGCEPRSSNVPDSAPAGMVWIPPGVYTMGGCGSLAREDEFPRQRVQLDGFWMDATEVTNAQFAAFVAATGYRTLAERPVDWNELRQQLPPGTPKPPDEQLQPGSLVFVSPATQPDLADFQEWWRWTPGACWKHPQGPHSTIAGKEHEPVVHIAYEDALAYCAWAGKALPTEAQWEYAARGGLEGKVNVWGDEPVEAQRANTWQGTFPVSNTKADGYVLAAPVKSFEPNGYGLYDMAGNVWEWCQDVYAPDAYALRTPDADGLVRNPTGPQPAPSASMTRVHRGGSFLCNDSYCASYRPSARMSSTPDTSLQHLGFRCVRP